MSSAIDFTPLWNYLENLTWLEIPSDLSEIDPNWVFVRLTSQSDPEIEDLAWKLDFETVSGFASDLRAIWANYQG